jgi:hypothetical protein
MAKKFLSMNAFICVFFLSVSTAGFACDTTESSMLKQEKSELADLNLAKLKSDETDVILYNFRTERCVPFNKAHTELEVSAFLPSDETTQGVYQEYRDQGESQIEALKHALSFMIKEQQS